MTHQICKDDSFSLTIRCFYKLQKDSLQYVETARNALTTPTALRPKCGTKGNFIYLFFFTMTGTIFYPHCEMKEFSILYLNRQ